MGAARTAGHELWRVADLLPRDRAEGWRDVVAQTHLRWDVDDPPADLGRPFEAAVRRRRFGDVSVLDCRCDPCAGGRGRRAVSRTDTDAVGVLAVLSGREVLEQDGREVELRAGDVAFWDSSRPARFAVLEPLRKRTLLLPRAALAGSGGRVEGRGWTARALPRQELVVHLLRIHAEALSRSPAVDVDSAALAARVVADLVGACVALLDGSPEPARTSSLPVPSPAGEVRRRALLEAVHASIDRRLRHVESHGASLHPDELTPRTLAAAHAMSVRSLHQLHEAEGESLSARVRRLRLEAARCQLERGEAGTVAAVAARWGFADAAHFTRAYKEHFGERPSDTLERALHDHASFSAARAPGDR